MNNTSQDASMVDVQDVRFIVCGHTYSEEQSKKIASSEAYISWNDNYSDDTGIIIHSKGVTGDQNKARPWTVVDAKRVLFSDVEKFVNHILAAFKSIVVTVSPVGENNRSTLVYTKNADDSLTIRTYAEWVDTMKNNKAN